jgi:hypothetical protein
MVGDPILYRVLTNPWLYRWVVAMVLPLLIWAVLVKISRNHPGILPRAYPMLRVFAWGIWASFIAWGLYGLIGTAERKNFYAINGIIFGLLSGTNLMYHWVRRRVDLSH